MEKMTIHAGGLQRRLPAPLPTLVVACVEKNETQRARHAFKTYNFSCILRGRGAYRWRGQSYEVEAPVVFQQWPDEPMDYGPDAGGWQELYIIFSEESGEELQGRGLFDPEQPIWPVRSEYFLSIVAELEGLMTSEQVEHHGDRIDLVVQRLIVESRLVSGAMDPAANAVRQARARVEANPATEWDFDNLASECSLSPTHFRRLWRAQVGEPPARYQTNLRMRRAGRRLVETTLPIGDIAAEVGYEDQLHFARRFRAFAGCSASEYRKQHRKLFEF